MSDLARRLGPDIASRLTLPLISAPMFRVSGPDLVIAACKAGVIGAFPTSNCRTIEDLDTWLGRINDALRVPEGQNPAAPVCANLIIQQARLDEDLARLIAHKVEMVITSVGSPAEVIKPLHAIGCKVFADVATIRHAQKAIAAGVDGLVLLTAGAGGQTGWANPLAFVGAVRRFFDGPLVLAGGVSDGHSLWAARALGCDLAYMGTRFIASSESMATDGYRQMLVASSLDDVMTTRAFTGLPTNMLKPSIEAAGIDPDRMDETVTPVMARNMFGAGTQGPQRWADLWSAGHSVSAVTDAPPVAEIVARIAKDYEFARQGCLAASGWPAGA
ncbi:MAG: nitronate monooxygenase [Rhodobacter sp.]|nr:nitronate monooxygenase [Rhodobacter sp.]